MRERTSSRALQVRGRCCRWAEQTCRGWLQTKRRANTDASGPARARLPHTYQRFALALPFVACLYDPPTTHTYKAASHWPQSEEKFLKDSTARKNLGA